MRCLALGKCQAPVGHLGDNSIMPYRKVQFARGQFYHIVNRRVECNGQSIV